MFAELLREKLAGKVALSDEQVSQLKAHYDLLQRWNKILNLTSVRDEEEIVERHYCESMFLAAHLPRVELKVADVGSGAGFPGFPVAVLLPHCEVTLIESHQRKAVFLREASRELPNVRVLPLRAEDVHERFDWAVCRAVNYEEIRIMLWRLAPNIALLAGDRPLSDLPGAEWRDPIRLPWGERRMLLVSRETKASKELNV